MERNWTFVTSNPNKVREAEAILGIVLKRADLDIEEIQSLDLRHVVEEKAKAAHAALERPVIVEDTGLFLAGFSGFPGPLVKWLLEGAGSAGLCAMVKGAESTAARAICAVGAYDGERLHYVEGTVEGTIVPEPRGETGFGWDNVFQPEGSRRTYAEMGEEEKNRISHRFKALSALAKVIGKE